eukprot:s423_g12.t3
MPAGRSLKRKLSDSEIYTHLEVYRLVRERKIHLAEELFSLAQSLNEGTYLLVFAIAVNSILAEPWGPTAVGALLVVLVYIFGPISGAYLNPAVSVAAGLAGQIPWRTVMAYTVLQITAGFIAGLACYGVFQMRMGVAPVAPFQFWEAAFLELLTNNPSSNQNNFSGLAIGLVIVAGGHAAGPISGAIFNPAAAIGLEVGGADGSQAFGLAYAFIQLLAGFLGAAFYRLARKHEYLELCGEPSTASKLFCEFFGTLLLCTTVGICLTQHSNATPWAAGAALSSIVYSMHDVSGGHVNPAVTVAAMLNGKCPVERGLAYCGVQLLGALFAGLSLAAYRGVQREPSPELEPTGDFSWMSIFAVETVFTCVLALVILNVSSGPGPNFYFGIAIGSCLTLGGIASSKISGLLNPAVVWSVAISSATESFGTPSLAFHCGEPGLLNYCTGGGTAAKRTLQKTIDAVWLPASQQEDSGHQKALCGPKLQELQRRALKPSKKCSKDTSFKVIEVCVGGLASILDAGIRRRGRSKAISNEDKLPLFDHFERQAEIVFRPHGGIWRLRDFFEVLVACRQQDGLAAVEPSPCPQGGLRLPRSEAGWKTMMAAGVAGDKPFAKLSDSEKASASAELRLCQACGAMPWAPTKVPKGAKAQNAWIYAMPKEVNFEDDTLYDRPMEEKIVRLWAKHHVEDRHLVAVIQALEACQHEICQTKGFDLKQDQLCVTGTQARKSKHKARQSSFGMASAQAALEDEKDAVRRQKSGLPQRAFLLTSASASEMKPDMTRAFYQAKALQDKAKTKALEDKAKALEDKA